MGGDAMRFIEARPIFRRPTLYSVPLAPSTSGAASPGQSPVTPPDQVGPPQERPFWQKVRSRPDFTKPRRRHVNLVGLVKSGLEGPHLFRAS